MGFVAAFAIFAFAYSFIGLLHPQLIHLHEYSLTSSVVEVGGHIAFGVLVTLPLWNLRYALLGGGVAIFIDSDHVLGALNVPVSSRPDHSILFVLASTAFIYAILRKNGGMGNADAVKASAVVAGAFLAHLSYDVFAAVSVFGGAGYAFPLYVPFSFALVPMPYYSWVLFELLGVGIVLATSLIMSAGKSMNYRHNPSN